MKCCLFLMASLLLSGNVFAGAGEDFKKMMATAEELQKEREEKFQDNMQDKMEGQSKMYNKYEKQRKNFEEEMQSLRETNTKLAAEIEKLTQSVAGIEQDSNKSLEAYTSYTKENRKKGLTDHGWIGIGQSKENAEWLKLRSRMEADIDKADRLNKRLAEAKNELAQQVALIADSHAQLQASAKKAGEYQAGYHLDKRYLEEGKAGESYRMEMLIKLAAFQSAYKLYNDMKNDHYEAKFLLTDFETLEKNYQITKTKLEFLKQRNYLVLQNTLIGDFVKQSIEAERKTKEFCEAVNKCEGQGDTAQKITDLERRVNDVTGLVDGEADKSKKKKSDTDKK